MRRLMWALVAAASLTASSAGIASAAGTHGPPPAHGVSINIARFEGRWVDLHRGWGDATACLIYPGRATECFRTVGAMDRRAAILQSRTSPDASCSTPLRLYDGTNRTGTSVSIYVRGLWIDLSSVSFDNKTSSFWVGACAIDLAPQAGGQGNHYTRCLYAGCVENVMLPGWDNVVSSAYLH